MRNRNVVSIGLGFECLKAEHIPTNENDVSLQYLVTEKQTYFSKN
jgi:5-formyltetrahydrofolate cyclo-ligase